MAKNRFSGVKKVCPCGLQVAVAQKTCPGCQYSFYNAKRLNELANMAAAPATATSTTPTTVTGEENTTGRRRTERVKREKPNYYDASVFEKKRKRRATSHNQEGGRERGRPRTQHPFVTKKKGTIKMEKEPEEDDPCSVLTPDKLLQCSIILAELNRKFVTSTWRV